VYVCARARVCVVQPMCSAGVSYVCSFKLVSLIPAWPGAPSFAGRHSLKMPLLILHNPLSPKGAFGSGTETGVLQRVLLEPVGVDPLFICASIGLFCNLMSRLQGITYQSQQTLLEIGLHSFFAYETCVGRHVQ
jgi:hypothetical protein